MTKQSGIYYYDEVNRKKCEWSTNVYGYSERVLYNGSDIQPQIANYFL